MASYTIANRTIRDIPGWAANTQPAPNTANTFTWSVTPEAIGFLATNLALISSYFDALARKNPSDELAANSRDYASQLLGQVIEMTEPNFITSVTATLATADTVAHYATTDTTSNAVTVHLELPISLTGTDGHGPQPQPTGTWGASGSATPSDDSNANIVDQCLTTPLLIFHQEPSGNFLTNILPLYPLNNSGQALRGAIDSQLTWLCSAKGKTYVPSKLNFVKLGCKLADVSAVLGEGLTFQNPKILGSGIVTGEPNTFTPTTTRSFALPLGPEQSGTVAIDFFDMSELTLGSLEQPLLDSNLDIQFGLFIPIGLTSILIQALAGYPFGADIYLLCYNTNCTPVLTTHGFNFTFTSWTTSVPNDESNEWYSNTNNTNLLSGYGNPDPCMGFGENFSPLTFARHIEYNMPSGVTLFSYSFTASAFTSGDPGGDGDYQVHLADGSDNIIASGPIHNVTSTWPVWSGFEGTIPDLEPTIQINPHVIITYSKRTGNLLIDNIVGTFS